MTYHDQFERNLARQRGGECADERPVRLEPLDGLPGQALGSGQGRETDERDKPMSRLRSTRTEPPPRDWREPEATTGQGRALDKEKCREAVLVSGLDSRLRGNDKRGRGDDERRCGDDEQALPTATCHPRAGGEPVDQDVASRPVGSEPPSVCARPGEILSRQAIEDNQVQDDERGHGDDEEGTQPLPRPLPRAGGEIGGSRLRWGCGDAVELGGDDLDGADGLEKREIEDRHCEHSAAIQSGAHHSRLPRRSAPRNDGLEAGDGVERRDDGSAHFPTPTPPLKGRGIESPSTRHDGWNPEIRVKFLNALANCGNVASAVLFVQRSRSSAYALKRRDADFATAWDAALLLARDVATDTLQDRAINGVEEDVMYHGEVVATRRRYDSRLLLAHIARLDKLAEDRSTSRAAARFEDVTAAIAAAKDVTPLITEPTEAEKRELARVRAALGLPAEEVPEPREPEVPFMCTYKDDPPEIYMMTQEEADALAAEVAGLTVRAVDGAEAVTAMAAGKDVPEEGLEADHAGPEEKEHDPVHIVNFGEEEERD